MNHKLVSLLSKDPADRSKKDISLIEAALKELTYFDSLYCQMKLLRGVAENATLAQFNQGTLLWREDDKQDRLLVLLSGQAQELFSLSQSELDQKRLQIQQRYPNYANIFQDNPARISIISYEQAPLLTAVIRENARVQKTQFFQVATKIMEQNSRISLQRQQSFKAGYAIPSQYLQEISDEVFACLRGVQLHNEFLFKYLFQGLIFNNKQGRVFDPGDFMNIDIEQKKHQSTLFSLTECHVLQMSIKDYQNLQISLQQQKQQKLQELFLSALIGDQGNPEDINQILKVLMEKNTSMVFTQQNLIYNQNQKQIYLYIIKRGEFQVSYEQHAATHKRTHSDLKAAKSTNEIILARVGLGCLLGEESFSLGVHIYKCISISSVCKVVGIRISDLALTFMRFPWFKEQLVGKQQTKQKWLQSRLEQQKIMDQINTERKYRDTQQQIFKESLEKRESVILTKFQKLKPRKQGLNEREISQIVQKQEEYVNSKKSMFENQFLCDLPIAKKNQPKSTSRVLGQENHDKEQRRKQLILRITQQSQATVQTQRDASMTAGDTELIPKLMALDKQQMQFLRQMMNRISMKQLMAPQEKQKPSAIAELLEHKGDADGNIFASPVYIRSIGLTQHNSTLSKINVSQPLTDRGTHNSKYHTLSKLRIGKRISSQAELKGPVDRKLMVNGINQFPRLSEDV